jgi:hypothetical protein
VSHTPIPRIIGFLILFLSYHALIIQGDFIVIIPYTGTVYLLYKGTVYLEQVHFLHYIPTPSTLFPLSFKHYFVGFIMLFICIYAAYVHLLHPSASFLFPFPIPLILPDSPPHTFKSYSSINIIIILVLGSINE